MSNKEEQEEELEVLRSIYDGDEKFKEVKETVFQYKVGDDGDYRSFLVEVSWGEDYPEQLPDINLNAFYNKHILEEVKESVVETLKQQADDLLGTAVTYTIFEYAKENAADLMENQPDSPPQQTQGDQDEKDESSQDMQTTAGKGKVKKEQLTKAQKRRLYNKLDNKGEFSRGHDWVDVIKHLSQMGSQNT